jgi:glycosyltransferase involved in cell wall biosynthesis
VGYLGQVKAHKGVDLLIDAWSQLSGDTPRDLLLYGSDAGEEEYGARLRSASAALPGVHWRSVYRGDEVWHVLSGLDLVVVPSRWAENSPNSILEAQAMGLPVIGSRMGGITEMIDDGVTGLLFDPDDAADLARKLQMLLDVPELLAQLRASVKPFRTLAQEIDHVEQIYQRVVADRAAPAARS